LYYSIIKLKDIEMRKEYLVAIIGWFLRLRVRKNNYGIDREVIFFVESGEIAKHALIKVSLIVGLILDMNQKIRRLMLKLSLNE
jgi:hypothetical protein